jgi:uncharacterized protein
MEQELPIKTDPFWKEKTLWEMNDEEWDSLCDRCGLCCLIKLRDADTREVFYTSIACKLLDLKICQCKDYPNRYSKVPSCLDLSPQQVYQYDWLPPTCAYRLVALGYDLNGWHHLISGNYECVHTAGITLRGSQVSEEEVDMSNLFDYIVQINPKS